MTTSRSQPFAEGDDGMGLVEVVVSMFILALLAVAFLPLLIQGLNQSAQSATIATATQLVNSRLDTARALSPNCASIASLAGATSASDARGVPLSVITTVAACPASAVGTVQVNVRITRTNVTPNAAVTAASTIVLVSTG